MIEWIALILGALALVYSFANRSAPSSFLTRQVAELTHDLRHLAQDMELLETKFVQLAGKVNTTINRKSKAKEEELDYLDMSKLPVETQKFLAGLSPQEIENYLNKRDSGN